MKQPSIDALMNKVDSKYTLVVAAAKRARMITEENLPSIKGQKPVPQALLEIAEGKIKYESQKTGIK